MKIKTRKPAVVVRFHPHVSAGMDSNMRTAAVAADVVDMVLGNRQMFDATRRDPTLRVELSAGYDIARNYFSQQGSEELVETPASEESAEVTEGDPTDITDMGVV